MKRVERLLIGVALLSAAILLGPYEDLLNPVRFVLSAVICTVGIGLIVTVVVK